MEVMLNKVLVCVSWWMLASVVVMVEGVPPPHFSKYRVTDAGCVEVDELCLIPEEVPNYEAIKSLHSQLDDDLSGTIDAAESVDFLKEELQYHKGYEKRQKVFHYNNDQYISVHELWYIWTQSEVHNWTVDQTVGWLAESVELQQYAQTFYENAVNGSILPRMAANNEQFLTKVLGIKDPKHRSKITIKAMDVVLFGPPKGSHVKDLVLVSLLTLALIGCFKAYQRNREYQGQLSDMLRDMEKLREAEENLQQLEQKMTSKVCGGDDLSDGEGKGGGGDGGGDSSASMEVQQLKLQLEEEREKNEQMKEQMKRNVEDQEAGGEDGYIAPQELQHWLQLTFERERIAFEKKQTSAREQFSSAREMCEKLNRQRRSLMGMLASVHGKMDNVDEAISMARTTMEEVTQELREREQRWRNIEVLSGCNITTNPGLHALELMLRPHVNTRPHTSSSYGSSIGASSFQQHNATTTPPPSGPVRGATRDSTLDLKMLGGSGGAGSVAGSSTRLRNQLLSRDSGSSLGSDAGIIHSHTFTQDVSSLGGYGEEGSMRRVWSAGSLHHHPHHLHHRQDPGKESNDSSTDEMDFPAGSSDTTSFTMGGSRLTLNSDSGGPTSQVSGGVTPPSPSSCPPHPPSMVVGVGRSVRRGDSWEGPQSSLTTTTTTPTTTGTKRGTKHSTKRGVIHKSYSQDTDAHPMSDNKLEEKETISASDPTLDSPKMSSSARHRRKIITSTTEECNSSDSSLLEDQPSPPINLQPIQLPQRPPSSNSKKHRHLKGSRFTNGLLGSLKLGKSKKNKESGHNTHKDATEKI